MKPHNNKTLSISFLLFLFFFIFPPARVVGLFLDSFFLFLRLYIKLGKPWNWFDEWKKENTLEKSDCLVAGYPYTFCPFFVFFVCQLSYSLFFVVRSSMNWDDGLMAQCAWICYINSIQKADPTNKQGNIFLKQINLKMCATRGTRPRDHGATSNDPLLLLFYLMCSSPALGFVFIEKRRLFALFFCFAIGNSSFRK